MAMSVEEGCEIHKPALMAHHPAWVGHHTGGSRSKPTVNPYPLQWGGCGLLTSTPTHNNESKKTQHKNNILFFSQLFYFFYFSFLFTFIFSFFHFLYFFMHFQIFFFDFFVFFQLFF